MTGYEYIKSMNTEKISELFMIGDSAAENIKNSTQEQMENSSYICPQRLDSSRKYNFHFETTKCNECLRRFLTNEVPM